MAEDKPYTIQLAAGLGLVSETKTLLDLWTPGMSTSKLHQVALESGRFPTVTARRLRNIVAECFAPRYLVSGGAPAANLKLLAPALSTSDLTQLMLLYTSRAHPILADFIRQVYWPWYAGGHTEISNREARAFVERGIDDEGYLTGCCADYGMLEGGKRTNRKFLPFRISAPTAAYLAYDLHFAGIGDNALLAHDDWQLFGLDRNDALEEIKRLSLKGFLIVQAAGDVIRISWKLPTMEALCDVLNQG